MFVTGSLPKQLLNNTQFGRILTIKIYLKLYLLIVFYLQSIRARVAREKNEVLVRNLLCVNIGH